MNYFCFPGVENSSKDSLNTPDNSGTSENSDNTVIFLPYNNKNTGELFQMFHKSEISE